MLGEERPRKKTKHSTSFLSQIKPDEAKPKMIAKPIPIHIQSTKKSFSNDGSIKAPLFAKIQTKLSSNKSNDKTFDCNNRVNQIISNGLCSIDKSIDNIKKWNTVDLHEANLKVGRTEFFS
jgi:hypothetical protein